MKAAEALQQLQQKLPKAVAWQTEFKGETTLEVEKESLISALSEKSGLIFFHSDFPSHQVQTFLYKQGIILLESW
jgi:hypothetical protein